MSCGVIGKQFNAPYRDNLMHQHGAGDASTIYLVFSYTAGVLNKNSSIKRSWGKRETLYLSWPIACGPKKYA